MTKAVTLKLDQFSQQALEHLARSASGSPSRALNMACMYYLAERDSRRPAWRLPRLASAPAGPYGVTVELDDALWRDMTQEATQQGVSTEILAVHAMLYLLADLDSGRQLGWLHSGLRDLDA
jgi:predicted transcriptional regulator